MMKKKENIQEICNHLLDALQATEKGDKVGSLEYNSSTQDLIILKRLGGFEKLDVKGLGGYDILKKVIEVVAEI